MSQSLIETLKKNQRDPSQPPHLSASSLALHMRCPRQWQQSYILGEKGEKSDALVLGLGVHLATSRLLLDQPVGDWWTDALEGYAPTDANLGELAATMVYHYWETIGKHIQPQVVAAEHEFYVDVPGVDLPILGYVDIETTSTLIDLKTTRYMNANRVRVNKEWRFQQGIYQLEIPKPSEVHVITRAKTNSIVIPDSTSHPLHFGRIDAQKIQQMIQYEWQKIVFNYERYGDEIPWPGNAMHDWAGKYCNVKECCVL